MKSILCSTLLIVGTQHMMMLIFFISNYNNIRLLFLGRANIPDTVIISNVAVRKTGIDFIYLFLN